MLCLRGKVKAMTLESWLSPQASNKKCFLFLHHCTANFDYRSNQQQINSNSIQYTTRYARCPTNNKKITVQIVSGTMITEAIQLGCIALEQRWFLSLPFATVTPEEPRQELWKLWWDRQWVFMVSWRCLLLRWEWRNQFMILCRPGREWTPTFAPKKEVVFQAVEQVRLVFVFCVVGFARCETPYCLPMLNYCITVDLPSFSLIPVQKVQKPVQQPELFKRYTTAGKM